MKENFQPQKYWELKILAWEKFRYSPWLWFYPPSWPLRIRLGAAAEMITARMLPGESILELGCGSGVLARRLQGRGLRYLGIDWAANAIEQASHKNGDANFFFRQADVCREAPPEADLTVLLGLTDWLTERDLELLFSRLASTQVLFSYTETKAASRGPYRFYRKLIDGRKGRSGYHARSFTEEEIRWMLKRAGYDAESWRRASFFNPGVLVWAKKSA